jgi:nitroreductase
MTSTNVTIENSRVGFFIFFSSLNIFSIWRGRNYNHKYPINASDSRFRIIEKGVFRPGKERFRMQTLEAIFSRRSVRSFKPDPISDEDLLTIVQAAAAAPSGGNAQRRLFLAVRQPRRIAALRALAPGIIGLPPAVLILCLDQRGSQSGGVLSPSLCYDIGAALQNLLLTAHATGLGACPVGSFHPKGVAVFLDLPEGVEPCLLVVLGKPKLIPPPPRKRSVDEIYYQERFEAR